MEHCCIGGKELPNRYAVAGRCEEKGCDLPFCALHWRRSNHRCREHGYEELERAEPPPISPKPESEDEPMNQDEKTAESPATRKEKAALAAARAKRAMKATLQAVHKLGAGASALLKRLKKDRSPEAMIATLDESLAANTERREGVASRVEGVYKEIAAKKKAYASAPAARKRILEAELKARLAEYKAVERELGVLLENERVLSQVKGRLNEMIAYGMAGVTEDLIDDVAIDIEDRAADADARLDAARELERAGRRRERESDRESFLDQLAEFDEEVPSELEAELAGFDEEPEPAPPPAAETAQPERHEKASETEE